MKLVHEPLSRKRTINFGRQAAHVLHCHTSETAVSLLDARSAYPGATAQIRVLNMIMTQLRAGNGGPTPLSGAEVLRRITLVGNSLARLVEAFTMWAVQSKVKLLSGMVPNEVTNEAFATQIGKEALDVIGMNQVYDLVLHATPGVSPIMSESTAAEIIANAVAFCHSFESSDETGPDATAARIALTNLLSFTREAMREKPTASQSLLTGQASDQLMLRTQTLRALAGMVLGIPLSARHQVATHFFRWLNDPWVKASVHAVAADSLSRALTTFHERLPQVGPYSALPGFAVEGEYDSDLIQLPGFATVLSKDQVLGKPATASEYFHPLAADIVFPLMLEPKALSAWVDTAWVLTETAQDAASAFQRLQDPAVKTVSAPTYRIDHRGVADIAGLDAVAGYPIVSPHEEVSYWPTSKWALHAIGVEPWELQTRAGIVQKMSKHARIPVRVTGPKVSSTLGELPELQPIFKDLDEAQLRVPMGLESLLALWDMTAERLARYLATLGVSTGGIGWRGIAQSLRFVGQLRIGEEAVEPLARHWYHARKIDPKCFGAPIELTVVDKTKVVFLPFVALPNTCAIEELPAHLVDVQGKEHHSSLPLIQWMSTVSAEPAPISILGWTKSTDALADIVSVPSQPRARILYLTSDSDLGPLVGRRYNAVVSVLEPVDASSPPTVALPPGGQAFLP